MDAGIAKANASEVTAGRGGGTDAGGDDVSEASLQHAEDVWAGLVQGSGGASVTGSLGRGREGEGTGASEGACRRLSLCEASYAVYLL